MFIVLFTVVVSLFLIALIPLFLCLVLLQSFPVAVYFLFFFASHCEAELRAIQRRETSPDDEGLEEVAVVQDDSENAESAQGVRVPLNDFNSGDVARSGATTRANQSGPVGALGKPQLHEVADAEPSEVGRLHDSHMFNSSRSGPRDMMETEDEAAEQEGEAAGHAAGTQDTVRDSPAPDSCDSIRQDAMEVEAVHELERMVPDTCLAILIAL